MIYMWMTLILYQVKSVNEIASLNMSYGLENKFLVFLWQILVWNPIVRGQSNYVDLSGSDTSKKFKSPLEK